MLGDALTTRLCLDTRALQAAFRLRYSSYRDKGFIADNDQGLFFDVYDTLPSSVTFAVYDGVELVASIRACVYDRARGWDDVPCKTRFPEAFALWSAAPRTIVEWNRFVISPSHRGSTAAVELALLASVPFMAELFDSVAFMAAVRERHMSFYRRFGYECISASTQYFGVTFQATLMAMEWAEHRERIRKHRVFTRCWQYLPRVDDLDSASRRHFEARFFPSSGFAGRAHVQV